MTALPTLSLATTPAPDAALALLGQGSVAVPGFAAMLAAAQPAEVVAAPVAVPQPADTALPAPPPAAAPRFSPAVLWQVIDGEAPLHPRPAAAGPLPAPEFSNELPRQSPETPPEDRIETFDTPLPNGQIPATVVPVAVEMPPEAPAVREKVAAPGDDVTGVTPRRRGLAPVTASPIAPEARVSEVVATRPAAATMSMTMVARLLDLPLLPSRSAEATPPTRQAEAVVAAMPSSAAAPPILAATPAAPISVAAPVAIAERKAPAAEAAVTAMPAPRPRAAPEFEPSERREVEPAGPARLVPPPPTVAGVAAAPAIPAPQPQTGPEPSGPAAAAPPAPANAPEPAAPVVTDRFGDVRIGLEGDARDLKVSLAVTAGTPALLAAEAPRLAADLAANGIRLQSLDVGSFAGGTASGGHPQRQGGQGPSAGPQAAFAAPVPPARAAAADRYA